MDHEEQEYRKVFDLDTTPASEKAKTALTYALDIRKFEIGLYWQRAAYFWALIAATFAGYFAVLSAEHLDDKEFVAFIIGSIGLIFSWAWLLVNRGSKYWQENWENHVDMLEDGVVGPLYKTILHRPSQRNLLGPKAVSVSTINLIVSIFTVFIWVGLLVHTLPPFHVTAPVSWRHVFVSALTISFVMWLWFGAGTSFGDHKLVVSRRHAKIIGRSANTKGH